MTLIDRMIYVTCERASPRLNQKRGVYMCLFVLSVVLQGLMCFDASAQNANNDIAKLAKDGNRYFEFEQYRLALPLYLQLEIVDQENLLLKYKIGVCYLKTKIDYGKAVAYLEFAEKKILDGEKPAELLYYLARACHVNERFDNAIKYYDEYKLDTLLDTLVLADVNHQIQMCTNGKLLTEKPVKAIVTNLGGELNSINGDYAPVISADQSILIFTSRREGGTGNLLDESGAYYEDIYVSNYLFARNVKYSKWLNPINIGDKINTKLHDASIALSIDGRELFIYKGADKGRGGAIYVARTEGLSWSIPEKLGKNINSKNWETSVSLSAEGNKLYFTSDREGGYGGKDIYVSRKLPSGEWGPGKNLGASINTAFDEESPFIHPNGKILYFSSRGHNSMGGYDIFKSMTHGRYWSEAANLGYPVNSASDDLHFVLSPNGRKGYFSSVRIGGYGEEDIYSAEMNESIIPLTMVRGTIITDDERPVNVKIKIIDNESNKLVKYVYDPNPETGKYLMIFPPGKNYDMIVQAEGYVSYVIRLHIPNQSYFYELYQTMYLKTIAPIRDTIGQGISVENTFYDISDTLPDTYSRIEKLKARQERDAALLSLIDHILETTDSLSLVNLEDTASHLIRAMEASKSGDKDYTPLVTLLDEIFEHTDSTALSNLDKIAEEGFFTKADKNVFFYGEDKNLHLKPITVGKDTIYVIPPTVLEARYENENEPDKGARETNQRFDEINIKTILTHTVSFASNQIRPAQGHYKSLDEICQVLYKFPTINVRISGYTDSVGAESDNLILSQKRAKTIADYFISQKIEKSRLIINAYGTKRPVGSNKTEAGRRVNRRVEIKLIQTKMKQTIE
ncbi:MAG: PD40 domain-containing protein [Flavobacteriales bacterium]|nr:PD40 domain-containing protein [Flavobacteriales bacterium]